jgi:hypothetical protein
VALTEYSNTKMKKPSAFLPGFLDRLFPATENVLEVNLKGLHSNAIIVGESIVIKLLGAKREQYQEPLAALRVGSQIYEYFSRLRALSPRMVPAFLETGIFTPQPHVPNVVTLAVLAPYVGRDMEELLRTGRMSPADTTQAILDALLPILTTGIARGRTDVGIDTKPANFCLNPARQCIYIDFVPPRFSQSDGTYLVDVPQPDSDEALSHLIWRYYTPDGILQNLLAQICRIIPTAWNDAMLALQDWLREQGHDNVAQSYDKLDRALVTVDFIAACRNPLHLRLVGCKLASSTPAFASKLQDFFTITTRYESKGSIAQVLADAKPCLTEHLSLASPPRRGAVGAPPPAPPEVATPSAYDVFLSYNSKDKDAVIRIADALKRVGLNPWLDEWQIVRGLPWIPQLEKALEGVNCTAVFIGPHGRGPWQEKERQVALDLVKAGNRSIVVAVLPDAPEELQVPPFLKTFTMIDMRAWETAQPKALDELILSILGEEPGDLRSRTVDAALVSELRARRAGHVPPAIP